MQVRLHPARLLVQSHSQEYRFRRCRFQQRVAAQLRRIKLLSIFQRLTMSVVDRLRSYVLLVRSLRTIKNQEVGTKTKASWKTTTMVARATAKPWLSIHHRLLVNLERLAIKS